jgi:NADP-dependent 3-hydroxy acid dehydrogenase YdfG
MTRTPRTILLTGSSSGIGAAIRDRLLDDGHCVLGVARRADAFSDSARYHPLVLDLGRLDTVYDALRSFVAGFDGIDAVISNAGQPVFGNLEQLSVEVIRRAVDTNLTSHLLVVRALLPELKRHAPSDVIVMGSESALRGGKRGTVYSAAKFGLRGFAQALRAECAASDVRVTLINPGMVRTPFFDDLDFGPGEDSENAIEPSDVAAAVSMVLGARPGTVFDEISLSPLKKVVRSKRPPAD